MYQVSRFGIKGFRRLLNVDLEIRPFMTVIGVNGVGKTSLLDAFSLLSASAEGNLSKRLSELGGIGNILTRGKSGAMDFSVNMDISNHERFEYILQLVPQGAAYSIVSEVFNQWQGESPNWEKGSDSFDSHSSFVTRKDNTLQFNVLADDETTLSQIPDAYKTAKTCRRILASTIKYHTIDVGPRSHVRLPQQMKPAADPGMNGEDLIPFLYNIRESSQDKFEIITDTMKAAFPDFKEFGFPPVAAGMLTMTWKDRNFSRPLYVNELSDGTLRFLWLASLLQSPILPSITMIDEPDVSLHPEQMRLLVDLMREASSRTRLVIATHSDRIVRFVKPEELMVFDIDEEGGTSAAYADSFDLESWLSKYRLDELWSMGHLTL